MTDAWVPAAFAAIGGFGFAPTLDLTIHIRAPAPARRHGAGGPRALPLRHPARRSAGVWEEDGELWTPAGELIAQSRQLALIRELPA